MSGSIQQSDRPFGSIPQSDRPFGSIQIFDVSSFIPQEYDKFGYNDIPNNDHPFIGKFKENFHHFINLQKIYGRPNGIGGYLMNGCHSLAYEKAFYEKQIALFDYSAEASNIIEVGVNNCNSLLIMLLSNNYSKITAIDICMSNYVIPCVKYLSEHFPNRITFISGNSINVLPKLVNEHKEKIDLFHIDGFHGDDVVRLEFIFALKMSKVGSIIAMDDSVKSMLEMAELFKKSVKVEKSNCNGCNTFYKIYSDDRCVSNVLEDTKIMDPLDNMLPNILLYCGPYKKSICKKLSMSCKRLIFYEEYNDRYIPDDGDNISLFSDWNLLLEKTNNIKLNGAVLNYMINDSEFMKIFKYIFDILLPESTIVIYYIGTIDFTNTTQYCEKFMKNLMITIQNTMDIPIKISLFDEGLIVKKTA